MDNLQFQKAEFSGATQKCSRCANQIEVAYFRLAGKPICMACAEVIRVVQLSPPVSAVLRGALWGAGAAAMCAIAYAILTSVTGASFALASIAVGYVVGRAVRMGSRGLGGRRCQVAAVAWTYLAICAGYAPLLSGALDKADQKMRAEQTSSPQVQELLAKRTTVPPAVHRVIQGIVVSFLSLAAPFIGLVTGVGGIIGFFIVFVGLYQAWKLTGRDRRVLAGPYTLGEETAIA
jgi:hypothetical protein